MKKRIQKKVQKWMNTITNFKRAMLEGQGKWR